MFYNLVFLFFRLFKNIQFPILFVVLINGLKLSKAYKVTFAIFFIVVTLVCFSLNSLNRSLHCLERKLETFYFPELALLLYRCIGTFLFCPSIFKREG